MTEKEARKKISKRARWAVREARQALRDADVMPTERAVAELAGAMLFELPPLHEVDD